MGAKTMGLDLRMTQVYAALAHVHVTVYLATAKSRTLASLYSTCARKKTKTTFFHEKLKVPTSKREGKLSNPRGRAARARCMEKIHGIYGNPRGAAARNP